MLKDIRTICWEGSLEDFKSEKVEIARHIKHIILECEDEYEYHYAFWIAMDPNIDRGYDDSDIYICYARCGHEQELENYVGAS